MAVNPTPGADGRPVVLSFWAPWCGSCRRMGPLLDSVAAAYPDVAFEAVRVDEQADVVSRYRVRATPTVLVLDAGGDELVRLVGGQPRSKLSEVFRAARASHDPAGPSVAKPVADRRVDVAVRLGAGSALVGAGLALGLQPVLLVLGVLVAASAVLAGRSAGRRAVPHSGP